MVFKFYEIVRDYEDSEYRRRRGLRTVFREKLSSIIEFGVGWMVGV